MCITKKFVEFVEGQQLLAQVCCAAVFKPQSNQVVGNWCIISHLDEMELLNWRRKNTSLSELSGYDLGIIVEPRSTDKWTERSDFGCVSLAKEALWSV